MLSRKSYNVCAGKKKIRVIDNNLTFRDYISEKNKAYSVLGVIKRDFIYMDERTFILLYKSMVRPHVEFANSVWCPYKISDLKEIEKI